MTRKKAEYQRPMSVPALVPARIVAKPLKFFSCAGVTP